MFFFYFLFWENVRLYVNILAYICMYTEQSILKGTSRFACALGPCLEPGTLPACLRVKSTCIKESERVWWTIRYVPTRIHIRLGQVWLWTLLLIFILIHATHSTTYLYRGIEMVGVRLGHQLNKDKIIYIIILKKKKK